MLPFTVTTYPLEALVVAANWDVAVRVAVELNCELGLKVTAVPVVLAQLPVTVMPTQKVNVSSMVPVKVIWLLVAAATVP